LPGVSARPILLVAGNPPFCETFSDNVEVPKANVFGEINYGWGIAKHLLGHEREMISRMGARDGGPNRRGSRWP
jgi:alkylation response protein AidB-like acyl-CoA dehydrogenase